ncbi:MAG: glucose-6-phosphate dehydrogenase assembly protein OpcA [Acidobacteriota bacterium]
MTFPGETGPRPQAPRRLDLASIERELHTLWKEAEQGEGGAAGPGTTRACVLNLVVVVQDERPMETFPDLITAITSEHPCRVLLVHVGSVTAPSRLEAAVSAHCHRPAGSDRQVCCEQITLKLAGEACRHLHGTVGPLLIGDLPVFVWWRGRPPFETHRFQGLAGIADRVVIDSAQGPESIPTLAALAASTRLPDNEVKAPGDLNWRRLSTWRELVASVFDPPGRCPALESIRDVKIRCDPGGDGEQAVRAFYLAGWLVSRLGWQIREATARKVDQGLAIELDATTHVVRLTVSGSVFKAGGAPFGVELAAETGDGSLVACLEAAGEGHVVTCRIQRPGRAPWVRCLEVSERTRAQLIMRELEMNHRDPVFEDALTPAGDLARLWISLSASARGEGPSRKE